MHKPSSFSLEMQYELLNDVVQSLIKQHWFYPLGPYYFCLKTNDRRKNVVTFSFNSNVVIYMCIGLGLLVILMTWVESLLFGNDIIFPNKFMNIGTPPWLFAYAFWALFSMSYDCISSFSSCVSYVGGLYSFLLQHWHPWCVEEHSQPFSLARPWSFHNFFIKLTWQMNSFFFFTHQFP